jgi:hypothetical protein
VGEGYSRPRLLATDPVVNAAIENRVAYLKAKGDSLYSLQIYYVVLYEGFRNKASLITSLAKLAFQPRQAASEVCALLFDSVSRALGAAA